MEYLKLAAVVITAHGFWKAIETVLQFRTQKKLKKAETQNLTVQANDIVINNLLQWSEKMEKRIEELEKDNTEMKQVIIKQRDRINELKKYIDQLEDQLRSYQKNKK
ncbi:hypothetical protein [Aquimarina macrocephali]|uniref:hypothetical protein n=1 Tax=Aquimarina macrocephali TaxID=666563 RepID=UPI000466EBD9|nr:hypothetical protein [Aquimarina macrocephali]